MTNESIGIHQETECDKYVVPDSAFAESDKFMLLFLDCMFYFLFVSVCTFSLKFTHCHDVIVKLQ